MRINPMVKKDIKVQARSMRICWEIFVYEAIMAVVFFFAMFLFSQQMTYSSANIYSSIVWLYPALAVTQIFILYGYEKSPRCHTHREFFLCTRQQRCCLVGVR